MPGQCENNQDVTMLSFKLQIATQAIVIWSIDNLKVKGITPFRILKFYKCPFHMYSCSCNMSCLGGLAFSRWFTRCKRRSIQCTSPVSLLSQFKAGFFGFL